MALPKGMKLSKKEVSQTYNTKDLFKKDLSKKAIKLFGEKLIEKMNVRSVGGEDYRNKNFKEYSKEYAKFKGVSRNSVDMVLKQKMLPSIKIVKSNNESSDLKIAVGNKETGKAFGHMSGFKGHPTIKNGPKRLFFGFRQSDLKKIVTEIKREIPEEFKSDKKDKTLNVSDLRQGLDTDDNKKIKAIAEEFTDIFEGL